MTTHEDEHRFREILVEECAKVGFGYASRAMRTTGEDREETQWCSVALAAMSRVAAGQSTKSQPASPSPAAKSDDGHPHLIGGEFQSDKYPTTPRGKVPLSVKDKSAQDLLWEYAHRRRVVDAQFADDLEMALRANGYSPSPAAAPAPGGEQQPSKLHFTREWLERKIMETPDGECAAGGAHPEAPKPRFFIEHDVIHDRQTGQHVRACNCVEPPFDNGIDNALTLLNRLNDDLAPPEPGGEQIEWHCSNCGKSAPPEWRACVVCYKCFANKYADGLRGQIKAREATLAAYKRLEDAAREYLKLNRYILTKDCIDPIEKGVGNRLADALAALDREGGK